MGDAGSDDGGLELPLEVIQAINDARPPCRFFASGLCKKAGRCAWRHGSPNSTDNFHIPHVSCNRMPDGQVKLSVRPPLSEGLKVFFSHAGLPQRMGSGKCIGDPSEDLQIFQLGYMQDRDETACAAAKSAGFVTMTETGRQPGKCSGIAYPDWLMHGTTVKNALSILKDGCTYYVAELRDPH